MSYRFQKHYKNNRGILFRGSGLYLICIILLFACIGILTSIKPGYRISSDVISAWTSDVDGGVFSHLIGMENRAFRTMIDEDLAPDLTSMFFQIATSLKPNDPRSLLGNEIPGFSIYDRNILIAGEGTDYTNLPHESSPPLDVVLEERDAVVGEIDVQEKKSETKPGELTTGERDVVFIYNTHNRESFLPHLPAVSDPNKALHHEVNISLISERLANALEAKGIGTQVDNTDFSQLLRDRGWEYWQSYEASREAVVEAFNNNEHLQYVFDLHRDALPRKHTTTDINGESYARIMFVVGEENANAEQNFKLASELNAIIEEKYPGLSRGVIYQGGTGNNGVYNQDLSDTALLIEFGGVENNLNELYRSAEALADAFSEYYWDAEAVGGNP